jgi:hypothetical protein
VGSSASAGCPPARQPAIHTAHHTLTQHRAHPFRVRRARGRDVDPLEHHLRARAGLRQQREVGGADDGADRVAAGGLMAGEQHDRLAVRRDLHRTGDDPVARDIDRRAGPQRLAGEP